MWTPHWVAYLVEKIQKFDIIFLMSYESVDKLQNLLADNVFSYTNDKKKAAGRDFSFQYDVHG